MHKERSYVCIKGIQKEKACHEQANQVRHFINQHFEANQQSFCHQFAFHLSDSKLYLLGPRLL